MYQSPQPRRPSYPPFTWKSLFLPTVIFVLSVSTIYNIANLIGTPADAAPVAQAAPQVKLTSAPTVISTTVALSISPTPKPEPTQSSQPTQVSKVAVAQPAPIKPNPAPIVQPKPAQQPPQSIPTATPTPTHPKVAVVVVTPALVPTAAPTSPPILIPTAAPQPTPKPVPSTLSPPPVAPQPARAVGPSSPVAHAGVNGNPWGYDFNSGSLITNPPSNFCSYFACIASFWNGTGYVVECTDATYSKSGGRSGSCSHHGGNLRTLYSH